VIGAACVFAIRDNTPDGDERVTASTITGVGFGTRRRLRRRDGKIASSRTIPDALRWDHNIHYFPLLLGPVPAYARTALDIGCGEGMLTRHLASQVGRAVGIDLDGEQIDLARATTTSNKVEYVVGDVMTHTFDEPFDVVVSVATLHHLDTAAGLRRIASLVAPGGVMAISGLARSTTRSDYAHDAVGTVLTQVLKRTGGRRYFTHSAPIVWPPKDSFADVRRIATETLPGVTYRRHDLWRYTLTWHKPAD
jgi:2-polyprenyl-3-methyl-5-hydroxy-6-metoxy-1,4-benzoquinol methylase